MTARAYGVASFLPYVPLKNEGVSRYLVRRDGRAFGKEAPIGWYQRGSHAKIL